MSRLEICLLGDVSLRAHMSSSLRFPTKKSKSLLAYLVVHKQRTFTRSALAGKFWPETEEVQAQRSLNTEVWRLRTMLKGSGLAPDTFLCSDRDSIGFRYDSDHWLDAAEFQALTQPLTSHNGISRHFELQPELRKAIALYRGDFLEGVFDDWCLVQREDYRVRLMAALEVLLAAAMEERRWEEAIAYGRRLLELDPLLEHVHRALMRCHSSFGNRPAALRQYATCERILRDELQIEPMEETQQLFDKLATPTIVQRQSGDLRDRTGPMGKSTYTAAQRTDAALSNLSAARRLLDDAIRQLRTAGSS